MSYPSLSNVLQFLKEKNTNFTVQNYIFNDEYRLRIKIQNLSGNIDLQVINPEEYVLSKNSGFFVLNNAPVTGWFSSGMKTKSFSTKEEMFEILGNCLF
jgi:hypothetical protein